jgi:hypothetical protein
MSALEKLASKTITKQNLYMMVEANFGLLPEVMVGLSSPKANVRYGCAAVLVELAAKYPNQLYPFMDQFIALLGSKHRILTWNAMAAIANLCQVDTDKKFDTNFDRYFDFLGDEYLVTVANTVGNSAKIAKAKPYLIPKITAELLKVEAIQTTPHLTEECRRVVAEKTVEAFSQFYTQMNPEDQRRVAEFVKRQTGSSRRSLNQKANRFLQQYVPLVV